MRKLIKLTEWFGGKSVFLNVDHIVRISIPSDGQGANVLMDMVNVSYTVRESPEEIVNFIEEAKS